MKKIMMSCLLLALPVLAQEALGPETIPSPSLAEVNDEVRAQLDEARQHLLDLHAAANAAPGDLAAAYGQMGMLYLEYGFLDAAEVSFRNAQALQSEDFRWPYYLGALLADKGRYQEAAASYQRVFELRPGDLPTVLRLAEVSLQLKDIDTAETLYEAALQSEFGLASGHAGLARIALDRGEPQAAIEHFEAALSAQPQADTLHHSLGLAYRETGDLEAAKTHLELRGDREVIFPDPLVLAVHRLSGRADAQDAGRAAAAAGDRQGAIAAYRKALAEDPANVAARRSLAVALGGSGDLDGAIEHFQKLLELEPNSPRNYRDLAAAQLQKGGLEKEGIRNLRRAVELDPQYKEGLLDLATALSRQDQSDEALVYISRLVELDPRNTEARLRMSWMQSRLGRSDEALASLETLLEIEPDHVGALIYRAEVLAGKGDLEAAKASLLQVVNLETAPRPRVAQAYFRLALMAQGGGAIDEALGYYRQAVATGPRLKDAQYNLATLLAAAGQPRAALPHFEKVVEIDPQDQSARYRLALLLFELQENERALVHFDALRAARPEHLEFVVRGAHLRARLADFSAAQALLDDALARAEKAADKSRLQTQKALIERLRGDEAGALEHYRQAVALAPDLALPRRDLAEAYGRSKRYREATAEYGRYLESQPQDAGAHFGLAMTYLLSGQHAAARNALESGLEQISDLRLAHLLARLLATSGDEAVRDGERALQLAASVFEAQPDPAHDETVAMALAASGRFDDALAVQRKLIAEAEKVGLPEGFVKRARENLARFESGQLAQVRW